LYLGAGSVTAFPVIETINSDITDYIATNVISITDGQLYLSKQLFINSIRPAIDSGLSVSRIGSSAQCKLMKVVSAGLKNELTNLRLADLSVNTFEYFNLLSLNNIFYHNHLAVSSLSFTILLLLFYRNSLLIFSNLAIIYKLLLLYSFDFLYLSYIIFISKHLYSNYLYSFLLSFSSSLSSSLLSYSLFLSTIFFSRCAIFFGSILFGCYSLPYRRSLFSFLQHHNFFTPHNSLSPHILFSSIASLIFYSLLFPILFELPNFISRIYHILFSASAYFNILFFIFRHHILFSLSWHILLFYLLLSPASYFMRTLSILHCGVSFCFSLPDMMFV